MTDQQQIDNTMETIKAMRLQENQVYHAGDYLSRIPQASAAEDNETSKKVDKEYRKAMAKWCYDVVDCLKCHRETVAIAMSYLDRFLMTSKGLQVLQNRSTFQLATMTCLYTAIKLHEVQVLTLEAMVRLSENRYRKEKIVEMEATILGALQWRMNPPISSSFLHQFISLLPKDVLQSTSNKQRIVEFSKFQIEVAVSEYNFVGVNASTIAFASLANALRQEIGTSPSAKGMEIVAKAAQIRSDSVFMRNVMERMRQEVSSATMKTRRSSLHKRRRSSVKSQKRRDSQTSPKSVVTNME